MLSDDGFELVDGEHDYNQVIKRFIRYKIDKIYDADAAREILYLLSLGYYGKEQHFNLKDFRNITIMREDSLERIVEWLVSNEWICESDKTPYKDKNTSRKFVITHDYYRDLLWEICIEDIDPEVRSNIDQYNIIYQQGALSPSAKMSATDEIYDRSREYICSERNLLKFVLYLFLGLLFVGNALNLHSFDFNHSIYAWEQALLQVVLMLSTIYVYNLYYHFLLSKYKVGLVAGFLLCLLCLWRASYWGIWLGLEVLIMGGIMLHIHLRYMREKTEDRFFLARAANFLSLGTVIVLLGYTYQAVIRGQLQFMFLFFSLYAIFICLTIRAHIHREYMLKLVGKAVYNT